MSQSRRSPFSETAHQGRERREKLLDLHSAYHILSKQKLCWGLSLQHFYWELCHRRLCFKACSQHSGLAKAKVSLMRVTWRVLLIKFSKTTSKDYSALKQCPGGLLIAPLLRPALVHGLCPRKLFLKIPSTAHGAPLPCQWVGVLSCREAVDLSISICPRNP